MTDKDAGLGGGLLLTDFYQLTMLQAYHRFGLMGEASFELFVRSLPASRGFLMAAGLEQALDMLEGMRFSPAELDYLAEAQRFPVEFVSWLEGLRFTGQVDAMPEGTAFFPDEPVLRVTAPLPEAQLAESRLLNLVHYQSAVASKAARMVLAAPGRRLFDFGMRRAHGAEAALLAARTSFIAGFDGTATIEAGRRFGIPLFGTMAHSFIEAQDGELLAFERFAETRPDGLVLLLDTYDTERAAGKAARLGRLLARRGLRLRGVRLDSGDLDALSRKVRAILDRAGLSDTIIFASGGLDETALAALARARAPIDGFGVGSSLAAASDAPVLDCAYKLQEYDGVPRRKLSPGKATWPGRKQVWRRFGADGRMAGDLVAPAGQPAVGEPLLEPVMRNGRRLAPSPPLADLRRRAAETLRRLPERLAALESDPYPVEISPALREIAARCDRRIRQSR